MYRILIARSGYYYVQEHSGWNGWYRVGGFFLTRTSARRFIRDRKGLDSIPSPRVVEYV